MPNGVGGKAWKRERIGRGKAREKNIYKCLLGSIMDGLNWYQVVCVSYKLGT